MSQRTIVGCVTGTSTDAIDAALVAIQGTGLEIRASIQRTTTRPLGSLAGPLRQLASLEPMSAVGPGVTPPASLKTQLEATNAFQRNLLCHGGRGADPTTIAMTEAVNVKSRMRRPGLPWRRGCGTTEMRIHALTIAPSLALLLFACGCASIERAPKCEGYSDWQTPPYILPYRVGTSCFVVQGNCSPRHGDWTSHRGPGRYGYDFLMPVGTPVIAVRDGEVSSLEEGFTDNDHGLDEANYVVIMHDDETIAVYGHLTHDGVLADIHNQVKQGDTIALSGASGASEKPHRSTASRSRRTPAPASTGNQAPTA